MNWYIVKVRFTKEFQDGTLKRVTEAYLVKAVSFTDAETIIYAEVGEFIRGEFFVRSIAIQSNLVDVFQYDDSDKWHRCKVEYITEDDNGKEKKVKNNFLVSAANSLIAYERIEEQLKGMMATYEIPSVVLTSILDVIVPEDENSKTNKK